MTNLFPTFTKFLILLVFVTCIVDRHALVAVVVLNEKPATPLELGGKDRMTVMHELTSAPRHHRTSNGDESACIPTCLASTSKDTSQSGGAGDSALHSNHQPEQVRLEKIVTNDRPGERGHGEATSSVNSVSGMDSYSRKDMLNEKVHSSGSPPHSHTIIIENQQIEIPIEGKEYSAECAICLEALVDDQKENPKINPNNGPTDVPSCDSSDDPRNDPNNDERNDPKNEISSWPTCTSFFLRNGHIWQIEFTNLKFFTTRPANIFVIQRPA
ncbi:hypothetical protein PTTG_27960 [Puccinia triticina 1-1 BBBD Race 1]|uniref:Uncharacterized protein n=1 Tax=Puccinia triticina (isolate 1-1 / race 1 (BBBD)) TaxID=630390 RepID=A0A180GFZ3_PUCT1|nr:hypothetical protein PTTG_27960 [Puccinia triticina 1-1 BBBD Race 1]